ncbi:biotin--[acetyl-CoA-carboxylase] ligase [Sphingomonas sp.]|uniref:biotin--[acetyl-CoA-carboxylase] ligase n=1 Tax=Sphingomonas sp. TaxID=28214 RepID=UPI002869FDBF|nr:biotin--[acetyl-CoA-carboxylase] ligase [Sphingomonas sp.]
MVDCAGSTIAVLLGDIGAVEGDWLVALAQDEGKGRQGRAWSSLAGNFFGSTLIQLRVGDPPAPGLSLACGLALIEAVDAAAPGEPLMLKWPNDLLLGGAKLAGILLERTGDHIVAGFGVNLAVAPAIEGRVTASLDRALTPQAFAPLLAASMARMLSLWRSSEPAAFAQAWLARAHAIGTPLDVHSGPGKRIAGRFDGLEADGALRLRLDGGAVEVIRAGDVDLR